MASYTSPTISGYNDNPPTNDGSADNTNNLVDWDRHIDEIGDPIKTYAEAIDSATTTAFTTVDGQITTLQTNTSDFGFEVTKNNAQSLTHNVFTAITWITEVRDPQGDFALASDTYVVPTDGVYQFNAAIAVSSMAAVSGTNASSLELAVFKNPLGAGSFTALKNGPITYNFSTGAKTLYAQVNCSVELVATDQIKIYARQIDTASANRSTITTSTYQWWDGHRVTNTT